MRSTTDADPQEIRLLEQIIELAVNPVNGYVLDETVEYLSGNSFQRIKDANDIPQLYYEGIAVFVSNGKFYRRIVENVDVDQDRVSETVGAEVNYAGGKLVLYDDVVTIDGTEYQEGFLRQRPRQPTYDGLSKYEIPHFERTSVLQNGSQIPFTASNTEIVDSTLNITINSLLPDFVHTVRVVNDGGGRPIRIYIRNEYGENSVVKLFYEGIPGDIDVPNRAETRVINPDGTEGHVIDRSHILYANGDVIPDIHTADPTRLFNHIYKIRYAGEKYYYDEETGKLITIPYVEIKDAKGNVVETDVADQKIYRFYQADADKVGLFDIPTHTVVTNGKEIVGFSLNTATTALKNGQIIYKAKEGFSDSPLPQASEKVYDFLKEFVFANQDVPFFFIQNSIEAARDGNGDVLYTLTGSENFDAQGFPVDGSAKHINFPVRPQYGDTRLALSSGTFDYKPGVNKPAAYAGEEKTIVSDNLRIVMATDDGGARVPVIVYDTKDTRVAKQSITGQAMRLDNGRLFAEYHTGKFLRDTEKVVFLDKDGLPTKSYQPLDGFNDALQNASHRVPFTQHYTALINPSTAQIDLRTFEQDTSVGSQHGLFAVWDVDIRGEKRIQDYLRLEDGRFFHNNFTEGDEIDLDRFLKSGREISDHVRIVPMDVALTLGQRKGIVYYQDVPKFEIANRYNPIVWRDYTSNDFGALREYVEIQFRKHVQNDWVHNIINAQDREIIKPLVTIIAVGLAGITILLPLILLAMTYFFSKVHFRKLGRTKYANTRKNDLITNMKGMEIRIRVARINRHLYLIGPFTDYLIDLYGQDLNQLVNRYYPQGSAMRDQVVADMSSRDFTKKAERYRFIEEYFVRPLSELILTLLIDQQEKWDLDMKGERLAYLETLYKNRRSKNKDYFVFTDRDLRRLFEYYYADKQAGKADADPIVRHGLHELIDPSKISSLQSKNTSIEEAIKVSESIEEILMPIKDELVGRYQKEHLKQPTFPIKVNYFFRAVVVWPGNLLYWAGVAGIIFGIVSIFVPIIAFPVNGILFLSLIVTVMGHQLSILAQYIQFNFKSWLPAVYKIARTAGNYKYKNDPAMMQKIAQKKKFFRAYFAWLVLINGVLLGGALYYAAGSLPVFAWIPGVFILLFTSRELIRSLWYLFVESAATAIETNKKISTVKNINGITKEHLDMIRNNAFFNLAFKGTLVEASLKRFHLVTEEQAEWLIEVIEDRHYLGLPQEMKLGKEAQEEIVSFVNKVIMEIHTAGGEEAFKRVLDNISVEQLLPVIFKGTGKKRIIPTVDFLDGEKIDKEHTLLKSAFRLFKENMGQSWKIFLQGDVRRDLLVHMIDEEATAFLGALENPALTLRDTIDTILLQSLSVDARAKIIDDLHIRAKDEPLKTQLAQLKSDLEKSEKAKNKDKTKELKEKIKPIQQTLAGVDILQAALNANAEDVVKQRKRIEEYIIQNWAMFRADGYLKTLLFAEEAGEAAFRVFLEYKLGRAVTAEDLKQHLMFVHIHEDIKPDKLDDFGGTEPKTLIDKLVNGKKGYVLNDYGSKIIVSTEDPEKGDGEYYKYPKAQGKRWKVKMDKWSIAGRFIEQFLLERGKTDAVIFNLDRDHFFYPSDLFLLPLVAQQMTEDQRLGMLSLRMFVKTGYVSPVAADHKVAEDVWNTRILLAESEVGTHAFYGPGIVRWNTMRRFGAYMSNIEDTASAQEGQMMGYRAEHSPRITITRPREMLMDSILSFQNRFGGLVIDEVLSTNFQKVLESDQLHWTEKLTLIQNFDFYVNKPVIPRYNLLIFVFAFFVNFTPFSFMALPLLLIASQYLFAEAITAGGVRLFTSKLGFWKGYAAYLARFWSLVFTFGALIPMHDEKARNAFKGTAGIFSSGVKEIVYPSIPFKTMFNYYRTSIRFGVLLLAILVFAPAHPYGVIGQFFFYVFPFVFIFGPFMKNAHSKPFISGPIFGGLAALFITHYYI
ncbi:MAG: hypothetical protein Q7S13_04320, partial [Candidatus Omnitrophota bacterium]|nr:hypothetical protein [Candidatus Omnitrophota bacterium]